MDINKQPKNSWIPEVDGLRAIAAIAVMLSHFRPPPIVSYDSLLIFAPLRLLNQLAIPNLSVIFFFTLSSFLLTYIGVNEFRDNDSINIKRFYIRRIFRIWPLYYFILFLIIIVTYLEKSLSLAYSSAAIDLPWVFDHLWLFLLYCSNWSFALNGIGGYNDHSNPMFGILWSIAVEEQFYILFPFLLSFILRSKQKQKFGIILIIVAGSILLRSVFLLLPTQINGARESAGMYYASTTYFDVFLAGGLAGYLATMSGKYDFLKKRGVGLLLFILLFTLCLLWPQNLWYPYSIFSVVLYQITGIVMAIGILWVFVSSESNAAQFLRSKPLQILGLLTYGIYLWHPIIQRIIYYNFSDFELMVKHRQYLSGIIFVMYILGVICTATITYILIEKTFLNMKSRYSSTNAPASTSTKESGLPWKRMVSISLIMLVSLEIIVNFVIKTDSNTKLFNFLYNGLLLGS